MSGDPEPESEPQTSPWIGRAAAPTYVGRAAPPPTSAWPADPWAASDPYGHPQVVVVEVPRQRSGSRLALITVGLVAAFCALGGTALLVTQAFLRNDGTGEQAAAATPPATTTKPKPPPPPGLNDAVRDGMFEFTVTKVDCGHSSVSTGLFSRTAKGQYCLVTLTVSNVGDSQRGFAEGFQKAIGPSDVSSWSPDTAAGLIVNGGDAKTIWSTVKPGKKVTGTIVFDVPKDGKISKLELHDSPFSDGAIVTL